MNDIEIVQVRPNPSDQPGSGHPREPEERQQRSRREQAQWNTVGFDGWAGVAAGTGRQRYVVPLANEFCALVECHPGRSAEGAVGTEQGHHLQNAHQPRAMVDGGATTTESGGTSLVTKAVAPTVELAPTVTPRSTVLRAHNHTPSSTTIGALS